MVGARHDGARAVLLGEVGRPEAVEHGGETRHLVAADGVHHEHERLLLDRDEQAPHLLGLGLVVVEVQVPGGARPS